MRALPDAAGATAARAIATSTGARPVLDADVAPSGRMIAALRLDRGKVARAIATADRAGALFDGAAAMAGQAGAMAGPRRRLLAMIVALAGTAVALAASAGALPAARGAPQRYGL